MHNNPLNGKSIYIVSLFNTFNLMILKLNLSGSAEPLINYLKSYLRIRDSLLLEIDTNKRAFVAKVFTDERTAARFASLTFDEADITILEDTGENERGDMRIKLGVLTHLKKLIQIIERFGTDADEKGVSHFEISFNYEPLIKGTNVEYIATDVSFASSILKMKMDGFRISEFQYLSDEDFYNNVFNAQDPIRINVSADAIDTIIKTSDIVKKDNKKDALMFYVEDKFLYVKNKMLDKNKPSDFIYQIGEVSEEPSYPISFPVNRETFIKMITKSEGDLRIILGHSGQVGPDGNYAVNRILFDSEITSTKIAIAGMSNN